MTLTTGLTMAHNENLVVHIVCLKTKEMLCHTISVQHFTDIRTLPSAIKQEKELKVVLIGIVDIKLYLHDYNMIVYIEKSLESRKNSTERLPENHLADPFILTVKLFRKML
jgi:hypothetical protein